MEKCLIVAVGENLGIGVKGDLPWHIPGDLKYFKQVTSGCPVIMGRTTYFSLPKHPLPGRRNIVLNLGGDPIEGVETVNSFDEAYALIKDEPRSFIIGGASVYKAAINDMDTLYITRVHKVVENADAFFPEVDENIWRIESVSETQIDEETKVEYEFVIYKKK